TVDASMKPLKLLQKFPVKDIVNNGHTVQANFKIGNILAIDNMSFQLKHVQFRAPSENTIKGKSFPLEAHFVHADAKGNLSIIAVMFKEGKSNIGLEKLWKQIPSDIDKPVNLKSRVLASEMVPANQDYYRFSGSLTTPPCSEGVRWLLIKTPMTASNSQIEAFKSVLKHPNNRPVQPLNGRVIIE
ncbi:MAG: carbonic anhydrase family protein, partial [Methylotenera sp.]|nr:carbonic anhydrase family protein [Methylotenera sp.]